MPGDGFDKTVEGEEQFWAQRCKLYIYRRKARGWVEIGIGKASLVRAHPSARVEFIFEDEKLKMPMARHFTDTATPLEANSGTDRGFTWTGCDQIQTHDGTDQEQYFTVKFGHPTAAQKFKAAFDYWVPPYEADVHGQLELPPEPLAPLAQLPAGNENLTVTVDSPTDGAQQLLQDTHTPMFGGQTNGFPLQACLSPPTSLPASPVAEHRIVKANRDLAAGPTSDNIGEVYLLYFEMGTFLEGAPGAVKEASTLYIGTYSSKEAAIRNAVRAMDAHDDRKRSWRNRSLWTRVEDCRREVRDKGTVVAVHGENGVYLQTKIRKIPLNKDLAQNVPDEGAELWAP